MERTPRYIAELNPACRLVMDELPPKSHKVWLITEFGTGFAGEYYPECGAVAWAPLPKLSTDQKARLAQLRAAGGDPTRALS